MKALLLVLLLLLSFRSHADEMRVGTLLVPWPEKCISTLEPRLIKVKCPDGEVALITPLLAKPGLNQLDAEAHFIAKSQDISERIMAPAAAKCGEVLGGLRRTTANNAVVYAVASRCTRKRREYYLLQYAVAGTGGLVLFTIEGFGNSTDQAARFDSLFLSARFEAAGVAE